MSWLETCFVLVLVFILFLWAVFVALAIHDLVEKWILAKKLTIIKKGRKNGGC